MRATFRRSLAAGVPLRGVALVAAAVIAGAAVLLSGGDGPPGDPSRLDVGGGRASAAAPAPLPATPTVDVSSGYEGADAASGHDAASTAPTAPTAPTGVAPGTTTTAAAQPTTAPSPLPTSASTSTTPALVSTTTAPATTAPATTTVATSAGPVRNPDIEAEVVPLTNGDRRANGLGSLSRNACLDGVASDYAAKLARSGALVHNPGSEAAVRGCRPNAAWGDNIGTARPCSASLIEERWMASPTHRHNILTAEFQYLGVGTWTDQAGNCWIQVLFSS